MAKTANYEIKRAEAKAKLIAQCEESGCGKTRMLFHLTRGRRNLILKPETKIVVDGFVFNLKYSDKFECPFVEDQPEGESLGIASIRINGALQVFPEQRCLAMYLYLHPQQGENGFFLFEDKKKKETDILSKMNDKFSVLDKIRSAQIDELRSTYNVLTGNDPSNMESRTLRSDLFLIAENSPAKVLDAFNDERTLIKFKLFSAIKLGYVTVDSGKTSLSWKGGGNIINVLPGENVYNAFAQLCLTENGAEVINILNKKLEQ